MPHTPEPPGSVSPCYSPGPLTPSARAPHAASPTSSFPRLKGRTENPSQLFCLLGLSLLWLGGRVCWPPGTRSCGKVSVVCHIPQNQDPQARGRMDVLGGALGVLLSAWASGPPPSLRTRTVCLQTHTLAFVSVPSGLPVASFGGSSSSGHPLLTAARDRLAARGSSRCWECSVLLHGWGRGAGVTMAVHEVRAGPVSLG